MLPSCLNRSFVLVGAVTLAACAGSGATVRAVGSADRDSLAATATALSDAERSLAGRRAVATLAVLPFEASDSTLDDMASGFAELLVADLARFPQLRLLERGRLDDVLREQGLDTARLDSATTVRVGRIIAAQQLVRGSMLAANDTVLRFDVGVVDVATSQVSAAFTGDAHVNALFAAERLVVNRLARALGLAVPPDLDARMAARADLPPEVFRKFAKGARREADGDVAAAAESYAAVAAEAPTFDVAVKKAATTKQAAAAATGRAARPLRALRAPPARARPSRPAPLP